jgi:hypothetical protein
MALLLAGCAGGTTPAVGDLLGAVGLPQQPGLDDATIASGLKEALRVGTDRTVADTSRDGGFLRNPLIRIPLPEQMDAAAKGLRAIGFGQQVDELEVAMNRAAEQASGEAAAVFIDAISQMSFADVRAIWQGPDDAATEYFRAKTSDPLRARFTPIVDESMQQVGLARLYDDLMGKLAALPLIPESQLELDEYVTGRTLSGLFTVLAQEEARIRTDPAARTTQLLQTVFGGS